MDMIKNGRGLIINTVDDSERIHDSYSIRHAVLQARVTYYTTLAGARAACMGMACMQELQAYSLQTLHGLRGAMPASFHADGGGDVPYKARGTDLPQI